MLFTQFFFCSLLALLAGTPSRRQKSIRRSATSINSTVSAVRFSSDLTDPPSSSSLQLGVKQFRARLERSQNDIRGPDERCETAIREGAENGMKKKIGKAY